MQPNNHRFSLWMIVQLPCGNPKSKRMIDTVLKNLTSKCSLFSTFMVFWSTASRTTTGNGRMRIRLPKMVTGWNQAIIHAHSERLSKYQFIVQGIRHAGAENVSWGLIDSCQKSEVAHASTYVSTHITAAKKKQSCTKRSNKIENSCTTEKLMNKTENASQVNENK